MKKILIVLALFVVSSMFAQVLSLPPSKNQHKLTYEQIKARKEQLLKSTGGFIEIPAEGPAIVVIDTRDKQGIAAEQFVSVFKRLSRINVLKKSTKPQTKKPIEIGRIEILSGSAIAIVVADCGILQPAVSVFPEERIAIVNSEKLAEGVSAPEAEIRITKEIWRSLGFVTCMGYASFKNDVLQPNFSMKELDSNSFMVMQPMTFGKMSPVLNKLGVKPSRKVPYRAAVRQGWAHAPTNHYQQAVWDEEKAKASTTKIEKANSLRKASLK